MQRKNFFSGSKSFRMNSSLWDVVTPISVSCIYQCLFITALGLSLQLNYPPMNRDVIHHFFFSPSSGVIFLRSEFGSILTKDLTICRLFSVWNLKVLSVGVIAVVQYGIRLLPCTELLSTDHIRGANCSKTLSSIPSCATEHWSVHLVIAKSSTRNR